MGAIIGKWFSADRKVEMLDMLEVAQRQGVSMRQSCKMLIIQRRRVLRWREHQRDGQGLTNGRPGPERAPHRVLPVEREQVLALARREEYADCSHRILTVLAWEQNIVWMSFSTTYRILKEAGLTTGRCHYHRHNGHSLPPTRRALTGPNPSADGLVLGYQLFADA